MADKWIADYVQDICVAVDRLGNALTGGSDENTISGRTGHWAQEHTGFRRWPWALLQCIIDITFYPLDGVGHCKRSAENAENAQGNNFALLVLTAIATVPVCLLILWPLFWLWFPIRSLKHPNNCWPFARSRIVRIAWAILALVATAFVTLPLIFMIFAGLFSIEWCQLFDRYVCGAWLLLH